MCLITGGGQVGGGGVTYIHRFGGWFDSEIIAGNGSVLNLSFAGACRFEKLDLCRTLTGHQFTHHAVRNSRDG